MIPARWVLQTPAGSRPWVSAFTWAAGTLLLSWVAPGGASASPRTNSPCSTSAIAFCEALEPVIEAVTDGRPSLVPSATRRAELWWNAHRAGFPDTAAIAPRMRDLAIEASHRHAPYAARVAVGAAIAALDACTAPPDDAARLMRLDLTGMAAWLRAHGVAVEFPRDVSPSVRLLARALRAQGHPALADALVSDVEVALAIPVRLNGDVGAANRLLACVDEVEKVVR